MLNLRESINTISSKFERGVYGFFIDTDFAGRIAIEQLTEDYDPMSPVSVVQWCDAPATTLCVRNRRVDANLWVGIGHAELRRFPAKARIIEAMIKALFMTLLGTIPDEDIIDAGTSIYFTEVERRSISYNLIYDEFMKLNVDLIPRQYGCVNTIVSKLLHNRIDASWRVIKEVRDLLTAGGYADHGYRFHEPYYMDLFGLLVYTVRRNPELRIQIGREKFYTIILSDNWPFFDN